MAKNIVIVILAIVAAGAGYYAYTGQTANQATQTEIATAQEALDAAKATAKEQADAAAAVQADLSNQVSTLKAELAEKTTELNAALAGVRQRVEDTMADLSAAKARASQLESKISALEKTLAMRNAGAETLTARLSALQNQNEDAQTKIDELTEKLAMNASMASPMDGDGMAATTEPEMDPEAMPKLPLEIDSRKAMFSSSATVTVSNTGVGILTVNAAVSGPGSEGVSPRELVIPAGKDVRLSGRDDWNLRSGQMLTLTHEDYEPLVYLIP